MSDDRWSTDVRATVRALALASAEQRNAARGNCCHETSPLLSATVKLAVNLRTGQRDDLLTLSGVGWSTTSAHRVVIVQPL
jgi:hypothetical protein